MPDIEEAIRSCGYKSFAVDIVGTGGGSPKTERGDDRHIKPRDHCGVLSNYAGELATKAWTAFY